MIYSLGSILIVQHPEEFFVSLYNYRVSSNLELEIVIARAAPAFHNLFHNLFMVMGMDVYLIYTVHKTVEKLTFQAFY